MLLANLDCGATHASAVAQRMGVTRQAMNRTVREMEALGYLSLQTDQKRLNQKLLVMTEGGMRLALDARAAMVDVEKQLGNRIGASALAAMRAPLELPWGDVPAP
jgi:DNA-binding MarR family transcriptional regulator